MAEKKKDEKKRIDVFELRKELVEVAEKEARKKPDISKQELKKKLSDHVTKAKIVEPAMTSGMVKIIETVIDVSTEVAVKMVEIYIREKKEFEKMKEEKGSEKQAPKKAKPAARKKAKK